MLTHFLARAAALAVAVTLLALVLAAPISAQSRKKAILLGINDIYRIEGIDDSAAGGMSRVRALRADLEKTSPDLLLLHAGDFLSPSFMGRIYAGRQMIDLMNLMDGNPLKGAFDRRMFVTFGNHEFDQTNCTREGPLARLVEESEFTWLSANLDFNRCDRLRALSGHRNIAPSRVVESGGLRIGLFGVTLSYPEYAAIVIDPVATACLQVENLRKQGVDAVVAVTHLGWRTDLTILGLGPDGKPLPEAARPCKQSPDLIIGGHDHFNMALPSAAPRLFKADADAVSAWVVEIERRAGKPLGVKGNLVKLAESRRQDPFTQRITDYWLRQHDERFCLAECSGLSGDRARACRAAVDGGACLKEAFAKTASPIETEEIVNRSFETGFGNWLTDQVRAAGSVDIAFINAGAIRINTTLAAGTTITRRHIEQMFPFKDNLAVREVTGAALWRAMERAVTQRGEGPWAHFSGMAVEVAKPGSGSRIARILVKRQNGEIVEIGPASQATFRHAASPFVLADGDGHGFEVCPKGTAVAACIDTIAAKLDWPLTGEGADIAGLLRMKLRELDPKKGLHLATDRRLCDVGQTGCLVAQWRP